MKKIIFAVLALTVIALIQGCATRIPTEVTPDKAFVLFPHSTSSNDSAQVYFDYRIDLVHRVERDITRNFFIRTHLGNGTTLIELDRAGSFIVDQINFVSKQNGKNFSRKGTGALNVHLGVINVYRYEMVTTVNNNRQYYRFVRLSDAELDEHVETFKRRNPEANNWPIRYL